MRINKKFERNRRRRRGVRVNKAAGEGALAHTRQFYLRTRLFYPTRHTHTSVRIFLNAEDGCKGYIGYRLHPGIWTIS